MLIFDYGCIVWMECTKHISDKVEKLQNWSMRIILKTDRRSCSQDMRSKLGLLSLYNHRRFQLSYRTVNNVMCPEQLVSYLPSRSSMHGRQIRDNSQLHLPKTKSAMGQSTFQYSAARDWNSLPKHIRELETLPSFKVAVFKYLSNLDITSHSCTVV